MMGHVLWVLVMITSGSSGTTTIKVFEHEYACRIEERQAESQLTRAMCVPAGINR